MLIFVSYNRKNRELVDILIEALRTLGCEVWVDKALLGTGGQRWWENVCDQIRGADLFIVALTNESLSSEACRREYAYAAALRKRILPVMLSSVSTKSLPAELQVLQFVDFTKRDLSQGLALSSSLHRLPTAFPLPSPLPMIPPAPISPLTNLVAMLEQPRIDSEEQRSFIFEAEKFLTNQDTKVDAVRLLEKLSQRNEITVQNANTIQRLRQSVSLNSEQEGGVGGLTAVLGDLFDFRLEEIKLNKEGQISRRQVERLITSINQRILRCYCVILASLILCAGLSVFAITLLRRFWEAPDFWQGVLALIIDVVLISGVGFVVALIVIQTEFEFVPRAAGWGLSRNDSPIDKLGKFRKRLLEDPNSCVDNQVIVTVSVLNHKRQLYVQGNGVQLKASISKKLLGELAIDRPVEGIAYISRVYGNVRDGSAPIALSIEVSSRKR